MTRERLRLANSEVVIEDGPAGPVARIERDDGPEDVAGPLPAETVRSLRLFAALLDHRTANYDCPDCGGTLAQPDPDLDAFECVRCGEVVRERGAP